MTSWRWAHPAVVRARIAALIAPDTLRDARLGTIVLREHQIDARQRLERAIDRFGGALLADEVGLGKTYTALATARNATALLVVAPAALASMWQSALERSSVQADFISFEALSRRDVGAPSYDFVIVDEAHHARNPGTHRYDRLAAVTRAARVLLLSATPVHNAGADLRTLLALFLGSRADHMTPAELTSCIVRRNRADIHDATIPSRAAPVWCNVDGPAEVLQALLEIPSPCPPRDGGDGGVLVTLSLVRAWASSEAALRAALRRRIARAESLADALASGRHPTRTELGAWVVGDDATQLAFPELVSDLVPHDLRSLADSVRLHVIGARRAAAVVAASAGAIDDQRTTIVREIRSRHVGERIVVYSQFADTVHEMFTRLRGDGRVAAVTANGAVVAGGPLTRTQVLSRFAPLATGSHPPSRAEAVELLVATDLLSEGLNLQDASVVVHLDLPWTAARLTQRMGRVCRIGSNHRNVHEYAVAPPAPAERLLRLVNLLSRKAGAAWAAVGEPFAPLLAALSESGAPEATDRVRASEELQIVLRRWAQGVPELERELIPVEVHGHPVLVAGVRARHEGWIAVIGDNSEMRVIASRNGCNPAAEPRVVLDAARGAEGDGCVTSPSRVARVMREIHAHLEAERAAVDAGVGSIGSRARSHAASRIAALAASAPPHRRAAVSRLASNARQAVAASRSAGAERLLAALVSSHCSDDTTEAAETWLERVIEASKVASPNASGDSVESESAIRALIVLVPHA